MRIAYTKGDTDWLSQQGCTPDGYGGGFEQRPLVCQEKRCSLTITSSFYVLCMNCRGLFTWLCVCKVLLAYGPPYHLLKPSMFASGLDRPCLGPAGGQTEPGGCGVKVCSWEPWWRLLSLSLEKLGQFLHPDIKKATWPESPGDLWPGTRWSPFDPSASEQFLLGSQVQLLELQWLFWGLNC